MSEWRKILIVTGKNRRKIANERFNKKHVCFWLVEPIDLDDQPIDDPNWWNEYQFELRELLNQVDAAILVLNDIPDNVFKWLKKSLKPEKVEVFHEPT